MGATVRIDNVQYGEADGKALLLDIVRPEPIPDVPMPVIVYIHGGGWMGGDKGRIGGQHNATFAEYGFFTVSINYRFSHEAIYPAQIHDGKAAIRWLRAHASEYHLDPNRIGVWGHSVGGHMAAMLGTTGDLPELEGHSGNPGYSSAVQAVCTSAGPVDLLQMGGWHDLPNSPEARVLGATYVQEREELAHLLNPIRHIRPNTPPFLIIHGDQDEIVPVSQAEMLYHALRDVTFVRVKGGDHDDYAGGNMTMTDLLGTIRTFFTKQFYGERIDPDTLRNNRILMREFASSLLQQAKE